MSSTQIYLLTSYQALFDYKHLAALLIQSVFTQL